MRVGEYRALQQRSGLTNKQLAAKLGVTEDTIVKRKGGRSPIDREAELAIKYIAEIEHDDTNDKH